MRNFTGKIIDWENDKMVKMDDTFGTWDYTVFGLLLAISSVIGFYIAWKVTNLYECVKCSQKSNISFKTIGQ